jgi:peptide/nickel transport system substrate-binding protein
MGKPGFLTRQFDTIFWIPLPKHAWEQTNPADLAKSDIANRTPLGWGPFMVQEWVIGDHITLQKNPNYFRASEGLPKFDTLVYRFLGEPSDGNLAALLTGECDVVDQTSLLDEQLEAVVELQQSKKLKAYIGQGPEWEHLDFGINPASTDKGTEANARPDFFSDLRTRQAFAYCIDRQAIVDKLLLGQSTVPASYYPPSHPLFMPDLTPLAHDVSAGRRLLDEVGWKVAGGDPQQPRQALGVPNVPDGTPLTVSYYTTEAALRVEVAKQLSSNLAECGIHLNVSYINPGELYATGPNGVLFGRNFDLAQFSWGIGPRPACVLYTSGQIPTASNNWLGSNITGFRDPNYDAACRAALQARPDQPDAYKQADQQAQRIFAEQLPSIPLFYRLKIAVSQPDLCGMQMDVTARSDLWNLESFEIGKNCK